MNDQDQVMVGGANRPARIAVGTGVVALVLAVVATVVVATGGDNPAPTDIGADGDEADDLVEVESLSDDEAIELIVQRFADAWADEDWDSLQALTADQGLDAAGIHRSAHRTLGVEDTTIDVGQISREEDRARAVADVTWDLGDLGSESFSVELVVRRVTEDDPAAPPPDAETPDPDELPDRAAFVTDVDWRIGWWYPTVHPDLTPERRFQRVRVWPERAPIVGADGEPLVTSVEEVAIGVDPDRPGEPEELAAVLERHLGTDPEAVLAELGREDIDEELRFLELGAVSTEEWDAAEAALADEAPSLRTQRRWVRRSEAPESFMRLIGGVGDVTAELLEDFAEPYTDGDLIGRSGLERVYERRLAGVPSEEARIVDSAGLVRSLAFIEGTDSEPVRLTLDPVVQESALEATEGLAAPVALVAVDARTGEVRASVSRPLDEFDRALTGQYAPGSTFKVITAEAMLADGVGLGSSVPCPGTITLGGQTIGNAGGDAPGTINLLNAFSRSCNTVFAGAAANMGAEEMVSAAERFGFNADVNLGIPGAGGSFPSPESSAELGQSAIGQGRVLASPLQMATVAAAVRDGTWHAPRIVIEPELELPDDVVMDPGVRESLDQAMREVVTSGTGRSAEVSGNEPVHGKTGSAQFGSGNPLPTHAWFIGYRGDLAFAVIVEGGGAGGRVAGPIAARFLQSIDGRSVDAAPELVPEEGPDADIEVEADGGASDDVGDGAEDDDSVDESDDADSDGAQDDGGADGAGDGDDGD